MYKALVVAVAGVGAIAAATVLFGPIGILLGIALTALAYSTLPNSHSRTPGAGVQRQRFSFPSWRSFMSSRPLNPHAAAMVNSAPPGSTVVINHRGPVAPPAPPVVVAGPPVILRPTVHSHVASMPTHARHAAVAAAVHSAPAGSTVRVTPDRGRAASAPPVVHARDPRARVRHPAAPDMVLGAPKIRR